MATTAINKDTGAPIDAAYIVKTESSKLTNETALDALPLQAAVAADVIMFQEGGLAGDMKGTTAQQIAALASAVSWTAVAINTTMVTDIGYITTASIDMTLPLTAAVGTEIRLVNTTGNFTILQNAGQSIVFNTTTSTVGVGGSIVTTATGQSVELVCTTADTVWHVISSMGAVFTIV